MKYLIGIVILAIIIIGGLYYSSSQSQTAPVPQDNTSVAAPYDNGVAAPAASTGTETAAPSTGATVTYTSSGFSPNTVTVKKGESVTFVDQTGKGVWVASARHPDHTVYGGTSRASHCPDTDGAAFDQCNIGSSYTFTFQKTGTWKYHNHVNVSDFGTVIVQ